MSLPQNAWYPCLTDFYGLTHAGIHWRIRHLHATSSSGPCLCCGMRRVCACRYLNDINTRYGRPIWLTELACPNPNGTLARQLKYARGAFKVLDESDYVERWVSRAELCN